MDKLQAMSVFIQIADRGSLTAAADAVGKSLPTVVRVLASLEDHLQARLFNRTTRRIDITEEGQFYLERCRKILSDIEETEHTLGQDQIVPRGIITLTTPIRFGDIHVAPSVTRFLQAYPQVQVNLLQHDRVVSLLDEGIDLAVRIAHMHDSSLIAKPVGEIRRVVCASPRLLEMPDHHPDHPQQLAKLPCVRFTGISSGDVWQFHDRGKRLDVPVSGNLLCNQNSTAIKACAAGLGFGSFLSYQVKSWLDSGELKIVLEDFQLPALPVSLVFPHTRLMALRVRTLVDWLAEDLRRSLSE